MRNFPEAWEMKSFVTPRLLMYPATVGTNILSYDSAEQATRLAYNGGATAMYLYLRTAEGTVFKSPGSLYVELGLDMKCLGSVSAVLSGVSPSWSYTLTTGDGWYRLRRICWVFPSSGYFRWSSFGAGEVVWMKNLYIRDLSSGRPVRWQNYR
jgi:hypothetical protein